MLPKENLPQIEVCDVQGRMYPCDVTEWLLHSLARLWIVKNYLACSHFILTVSLPENSSSLPVFGCADMVSLHQFHCLLPAKFERQKAEEVVCLVVLHTGLYYL